tara:strand:+ start:1244 stop:1498 length:255 start_codon:yes stop_codon:yes gene_type:complete
MTEESSTSVDANSKHYPTFDTNWVTIKIDRAELTVFCHDLQQMAVLAKQLTFAVDQAIRERVNDYDAADVIEQTANVRNIKEVW